jgi:hypothetical protein
MNAYDNALTLAPRASDAVRSYVDAPSRYRARDVGVGYGRSSGYAMEKRYSSDWGGLRFRFR